jgi:hypothetical protein
VSSILTLNLTAMGGIGRVFGGDLECFELRHAAT